MKFMNTSNKVIGIGGRYVMPGQAVDISDEEAQLPAVRVYVEMGLVSIEGNPAAEKSRADSGNSAAVDGSTARDSLSPEPKTEGSEEAAVNEETPDYDEQSRKVRKTRAASKT